MKQCLDPSIRFTAEQLDSTLRSLLDKHTPITSCKISEKKFEPWYNNIKDVLQLQKSAVAKQKDAGALVV